MSDSGYDIEDAVVLNRAAVDRGFGRTIVLKKMMTSLKRYGNMTEDRIHAPQQGLNQSTRDKLKHACLERDGIVGVGCKVSNGQVLINKAVPKDISSQLNNPRDLPQDAYRAQPLVCVCVYIYVCIYIYIYIYI